MYDNSLYKEIGNKKVKEFIRKIPKDIKENCTLRKIEKDKIVVLKEEEIKKIYIHCKGQMRVRMNLKMDLYMILQVLSPYLTLELWKLWQIKKCILLH